MELEDNVYNTTILVEEINYVPNVIEIFMLFVEKLNGIVAVGVNDANSHCQWVTESVHVTISIYHIG